MIEYACEAWDKFESMPEVGGAILEAFNQGRVTRENFAQGIGALLPAELLENRTSGELRTIELCIVYEATRRQRAELVVRLKPRGIYVRGDEYWRQITSNSDGSVGYFDDLAPFYRNTLINLNSTSLQMKTAVNQRVFDCPAAGGFLITDAQGDLEELFDAESEVVSYESLDELDDKTAYYLKHPEARLPVIERARKRIAAQHTHMHRLRSLELYLRERYE